LGGEPRHEEGIGLGAGHCWRAAQGEQSEKRSGCARYLGQMGTK
jgi:hypothetical protein